MSPRCGYLLTIVVSLFIGYPLAQAATITVTNKCSYTVWAAALAPSGGFPETGKQLNQGESWNLPNLGPNLPAARIWGRTGCQFDSSGSNGHCKTGDCNGQLQCKVSGQDPQTLAEFTLTSSQDTIDISLINGFNVPLAFTPTSNIGGNCQAVSCKGTSIIDQCPQQLKTDGGCNHPCTVFPGVKYCCSSLRGQCSPSDLTRFFKDRCPDAYSYAEDDQTSTKACPSGTNYDITFCP